MRKCSFCALLVAAFLILAPNDDSGAGVFYARDEALELAFPNADRTETKDFFLTPEQRSRIESLARAPLDSSFLTVYVGYQGREILGYAVIDTHLVRTLPETFLVVISPDGAIAATHVLAFYEPSEYLPTASWLRQFAGATLSDDLHVGRKIAGITGSTLTSRAVTSGIRRALAIYEALLRKQD